MNVVHVPIRDIHIEYKLQNNHVCDAISILFSFFIYIFFFKYILFYFIHPGCNSHFLFALFPWTEGARLNHIWSGNSCKRKRIAPAHVCVFFVKCDFLSVHIIFATAVLVPMVCVCILWCYEWCALSLAPRRRLLFFVEPNWMWHLLVAYV